MEGLLYVREKHVSLGEGCYLPWADLLGQIESSLEIYLYQNPNIKAYIPPLMDTDLFVMWDEQRFILLVAPEKRSHVPARGMDTKYLATQRQNGTDWLGMQTGFADVSETPWAQKLFAELRFNPGFAATGTFAHGVYSTEGKAAQAEAGRQVANLFQAWADTKRQKMENSKIFLSHKGINKPLVEKIDQALRMLNLKTWFDRDDLSAGDSLLRGIDEAFSGCTAAVFFISGEYIDAGVIRREIDRAVHESVMREGSFRVIPLVLREHGGTDDKVPNLLQTVVWKAVDDIEIVPSILKALPASVQALVSYNPVK